MSKAKSLSKCCVFHQRGARLKLVASGGRKGSNMSVSTVIQKASTKAYTDI